MRKKSRPWMAGMLLLSILFCLGTVLYTRVNPLTEELALARISDAASNVINEAVNQQIAEGNIRYDDLVTLQQDSAGNITALTTNMQAMNLLKSQLLLLLDEKIHELDDDEIGIPTGNLTGVQLLSGRGPQIPVKIVSVANSDAKFDGTFSDAGINQTHHRIMLTVALDLVILLPSGTVNEHVETDVCVAETVLLGRVPESYTYFNSVGQDDVSKFFTNE